MRWWLFAPLKAAKLIINEIRELFIFLIVRWPNTPLGFWLRKVYWGRKTGVKNIMVWRGANLFDCNWIEFGDNLQFGENVEFVVDGVEGYRVFVGSNILFARGVFLRSANHRIDDPNKLILEQGHSSKKINYNGVDYAVVIESNAWIGANVIILSGAFIGEGASIGAGSVVTGVIPPYSVAAGCPARVISKRTLEANGN